MHPTLLGPPMLLGSPVLLGRIRSLGQDTVGSRLQAAWPTIAGVAVLASASVSAYHGFKRNGTVWGGILWFFLGSLFPIVTPIAALALPPGFAKSKK